LDGGVSFVAGGLARLFQHLVYLIEVEITEQRRDDGLNAKDNFQFDRAVGYRQEGKRT
jgi:hypothetical protein